MHKKRRGSPLQDPYVEEYTLLRGGKKGLDAAGERVSTDATELKSFERSAFKTTKWSLSI